MYIKHISSLSSLQLGFPRFRDCHQESIFVVSLASSDDGESLIQQSGLAVAKASHLSAFSQHISFTVKCVCLLLMYSIFKI